MLSPLNVAVTASGLPTGRADVVRLADWPLLTGAVPRTAVPTRKVTLPVTAELLAAKALSPL